MALGLHEHGRYGGHAPVAAIFQAHRAAPRALLPDRRGGVHSLDMTNPAVLWPETVSGADTAQAGGKGASLGEMIASGFPVPPRFVVTAPVCERFAASCP